MPEPVTMDIIGKQLVKYVQQHLLGNYIPEIMNNPRGAKIDAYIKLIYMTPDIPTTYKIFTAYHTLFDYNILKENSKLTQDIKSG